jgi:transglutaminase-like putative cysteine protease
MRRPAALALTLVPILLACPEQRPQPTRQPPRPPPGVLAAGAGVTDVLTIPRPDGPQWFGVYLVGKKAGWTRVEMSRELRDGRDVLVGRSEMLLRVNVGGNTVERRQTEERVYEARPAGALVSARATFSGDGGDRSVTATCRRQRCDLVVVGENGAREERAVEGVTETADLGDGVRLAAFRRTTVRGGQLDLMKVRVREAQDAFLRRERVAGAGVQEEVSVVAESQVDDRIALEYRVADDGRVVEIRLGDAFVGRPEPEERARSLEEVDLFALGRVDLPRPLPRAVPATIVYGLQGLPPAFANPDARQRYARGPGGTTLLTVSARRPAAADPAKDTPLGKAGAGASPDDLRPTGEADSDSPAIVRLAREVAGDAPGAYAAALKLSDHVYRTLEKAYGASHDRASDVLAAGRGDCTEHAILLVALSRALGIPARQVYGLVYARYADGKDALYWHAWAEIRSAGEWIAIDPIFGQSVADATHLSLGRGKQEDAVGLLGALKVATVDVKEGG